MKKEKELSLHLHHPRHQLVRVALQRQPQLQPHLLQFLRQLQLLLKEGENQEMKMMTTTKIRMKEKEKEKKVQS